MWTIIAFVVIGGITGCLCALFLIVRWLKHQSEYDEKEIENDDATRYVEEVARDSGYDN